MAAVIPITLVGDNLGKRHLYLNTLVDETYKRGEDFDIIKNLSEQSPIDRIFKIDLASKLKNVDYIIQNLKEEDMLYVSRALKSTWLIDEKYEEIINPQYLEDVLYPQMYTPAVTKMQHWIHLTLKDESRCRQFYQHYNEKNFDLAIKFLLKCSKDFILNEFAKVVHKITPHYFKVLCEKCSQVATIFFDSLTNDNELKNQYLNKEKEYFSILRYFLKTDADMVLDITEKYFNRHDFKRFSELQTKFIMNNQKKRFLNKPELYAGWLLNMQAIADSLNTEEAKDLVLKLAKAMYLTYSHWFNYKAVEPLIKRLKVDERAEFKKKIFVIKDIGEVVEEWPYETPESPGREAEQSTIFEDEPPDLYEYENLIKRRIMKRLIKKKRGPKSDFVEIFECSGKVKTLLDKLFDEYRFVSFGRTLYDLKKRIAAESSPQNREFMILVLISKSGGRPDAIALLLELLARHGNEPANVRAAIIRSLVKRAHVWRLPETSWNKLLEFGQGLGLDGMNPVADCFEGLHAVVIRSLILTGECAPAVQKAFLSQFSTLTDYALTTSEKNIIKQSLPRMLFSIAKEKENIAASVQCIDRVIDTLNAYKIRVETYPGLIETIISLAEKDVTEILYLIHQLFDARIARKQLYRYTFGLKKSDASYVNALKHDTTLLDGNTFSEYLVSRFIIKADLFLNKLALYFGEKNGLASQFLEALKSKGSDKLLAKPLAFLLSNQLESYLHEKDSLKDIESKLLASAIKANAHITRPSFDITVLDWKKVGVKHIANRFSKCPQTEIDKNIKELLQSKRTAKLALSLSKRTIYETDIFVKFAAIRPTVALKLGLKILKLNDDDKLDSLIWETIKPIIQKLDISKVSKCYIVKSMENIDKMPLKIRPEYSTVIYILFIKSSLFKAMPPLCYVEILLPDVNEFFIEDLLTQFLKTDFTIEKLSMDSNDVKCTVLYIRILVKYLLLCKDEVVQKERFARFGEPIFAKMEEIKKSDKKKLFEIFFPQILKHLKYHKVFLDNQYVSALPVMENVVAWMHKLFPVEKHFQTYAQLHLSMLYFKAVRQSLKLAPEVFSDEKRRKEGVELVGVLFGKYAAREVSSLSTKYFESMPEMYSESLVTYLEKFSSDYCYITSDFLSSIIKGILEGSKGSEYRLGVHLLREKYYNIKDEKYDELKQYLNERKEKDVENQFLICAYF